MGRRFDIFCWNCGDCIVACSCFSPEFYEIQSIKNKLDKLREEISARDRMIEDGKKIIGKFFDSLDHLPVDLDEAFDTTDISLWLDKTPDDYREGEKYG